MVSSEKIGNWLTNGVDEHAIAGVGVDAESVNRFLISGEIPAQCPNPNMLPYQAKLVRRGGFLYYTYPFIQRFESYSPRIARKISKAHYGNTYALADESILDGLGYYALRNSIVACYKVNIGIQRDAHSIGAMTGYLFPEMTKSLVTENPDLGELILDSEWDESGHSGLEDSNIPLGELKKILEACLRRRGVLVFYNEGIFNHKVLTNYEDEKDVMILSRSPLTQEVVSGIKPLSETDREVMLQGVEL